MIDGNGGLRSEFASFLKTHRCNIPHEASALGPWERLPMRRGRPVTQEEIAEAAGVSRNWYRRLESGDEVRASIKLLDRLASVFGFGSEERRTFFLLGIPEMASPMHEL